MVQCENSVNSAVAKTLAETVRSVLTIAQQNKRIVLGFSDAIKLLSKTPEEAQFCFLAEPKHGDSATHMHEVLLQAFCYEHDIYIIKVDSGKSLANILKTNGSDESCVLIRKSSQTKIAEEDLLINYLENCWDDSNYCVVQLPES